MAKMTIEDFKNGAYFTIPFTDMSFTVGNRYHGMPSVNYPDFIEFFNDVFICENLHISKCYTWPLSPKDIEDFLQQQEEDMKLEAANDEDFVDEFTEGLVEGEDILDGILSQFATQYGGSHYNGRSIQPLQYIMANDLDFCQGNVVKYITRFRDKNGVEDLQKVIHYTQFILEAEYGVFSEIRYAGLEEVEAPTFTFDEDFED